MWGVQQGLLEEVAVRSRRDPDGEGLQCLPTGQRHGENQYFEGRHPGLKRFLAHRSVSKGRHGGEGYGKVSWIRQDLVGRPRVFNVKLKTEAFGGS